ncbi:MAG: aspartyl protease family protein [Myxococcales bacterium]|nr:aspartyl protease family protein [Myxococcales bacterium]
MTRPWSIGWALAASLGCLPKIEVEAPPTSTPPTVAAAPTTAAAFRHEVPIEVVQGVAIVQVRVDGLDRPLSLAIDSGAPTLLRTSIAAELGLVSGEVLRGDDAHGDALTGARVVIPALRVGELRVEDVAGLAVELPDFAVLCHELDGLLGVGIEVGTGFLDRVAIELDYDRERLVLADSAASLSQGGVTTRLTRAIEGPSGPQVYTASLLPAVIDGQEGWIAIDTGNNGEVHVNRDVFDALGYTAIDPSIRTRRGLLSASASGTQSGFSHEARLRSLVLGGVEFQGVPMTVPPAGNNAPVGVMLGYEFLRHFTVILDHPGETLRLVPIAGGDPSESAPELGFGFLEQQGKVEVVMLLAGGPAEEAGVALGDELIEFEGRPIAAGDVAAQCEARGSPLRRGDEPVSVRLRRDDREWTVEITPRPALPPWLFKHVQ